MCPLPYTQALDAVDSQWQDKNPITRVVQAYKELTDSKSRKVCLLTLLDHSEELWGELAEDLLHCLTAGAVSKLVPSVVNQKDDYDSEHAKLLLFGVLNGAKLRGE